MGDEEKETMQKGKLYEPTRFLPVESSDDVPVTTIAFR